MYFCSLKSRDKTLYANTSPYIFNYIISGIYDKMKPYIKKYFCFLLIGILTKISVIAQIPVGYYDAADGKSGAELKTAMHKIIYNFINLDFDGFSATYWGEHYFQHTDFHPDGYYWDMYSDIERRDYNSSQLAREHCMPRSWWGTASAYGRANSDLHNLFPSDFTANGKKSNLPLGETANPLWTNNTVKIGTNSFSSDYTGNIFEPSDDYKGDFARTYLYMATSYQDYENFWQDEGLIMLNNETYPVFNSWAVELLLSWCREDAVSRKEINRNDSVFRLQQNRNPFIDIPDLAEYIWGSKTGQSISISDQATQPTLTTPSGAVSVNFGSVATSHSRTRSIPVKGHLLNSALTVDFIENSSGFFSTENTVSALQANSAEGYFLPVAYSPASEGAHTATIRISSPDFTVPLTVYLRGDASYSPYTPPVEPTDEMDVLLFYTGSWDKSELPDNFITNAASAPYSNGDFSFRSDNEYLIVEINETPDILQFAIYPRNAWGTNDNHLYVYEGTDAGNFNSTPVADFDNAFVTGSPYNNTPQIQLSEHTRAIKIEYKKVAQNVGINNLIITRKQPANLTEQSTSAVKLFCTDGLLHIENLNIGETVYIYDIFGRQIIRQTVSGSQTVIPFRQQGIFLVRTQSGIYKFVSR